MSRIPLPSVRWPRPWDLSLHPSEQNGQKESPPTSTRGPASAPMADRRSGCVPAEPYPPADGDGLTETKEDAKHSEMKPVEVGNPNP